MKSNAALKPTSDQRHPTLDRASNTFYKPMFIKTGSSQCSPNFTMKILDDKSWVITRIKNTNKR